MRVQNLMEDYVYSRVNEMYNKLSEHTPAWVSCTCESCKLDVLTYVLNKVHPRYVVSGRGVLHSAQMFDSQIRADVDALIMEGIHTISNNTRPDHKIKAQENALGDSDENSPAFNFPVITGLVLNGTTFEPFEGAEILLKDETGKALMFDSSWDNPCKTYKSTKGNFSFWPSSIPAEKEGIFKKFKFVLEISAEGCAPLTSAIELPVISDKLKKVSFDSNFTLRIKDSYLFKN